MSKYLSISCATCSEGDVVAADCSSGLPRILVNQVFFRLGGGGVDSANELHSWVGFFPNGQVWTDNNISSSIILSLGSAGLNRGSRNVQISRRSLNSELPYLLSRSTLTTYFISAVRELSVSFSTRISLQRRVRSGRTAQIVMFFSAERASVSSPRGLRAAIIDIKILPSGYKVRNLSVTG